MRDSTRSGRPPKGEGKEIRSASSTSRSRSVFHVETEDVCDVVSSSSSPPSSVALWGAVMSKRTVEDVGPTDGSEGEREDVGDGEEVGEGEGDGNGDGEEEGEGGATGSPWGEV